MFFAKLLVLLLHLWKTIFQALVLFLRLAIGVVPWKFHRSADFLTSVFWDHRSRALASWTARFRSRCSASEISASPVARSCLVQPKLEHSGALPWSCWSCSMRLQDLLFALQTFYFHRSCLPCYANAVQRCAKSRGSNTSSTVKAFEKWRGSWQTALKILNILNKYSTLQNIELTEFYDLNTSWVIYRLI